MASTDSSIDGSSNGDTLSRSYSNNERNRDSTSRDYDSFKQPGDKAMHELQVLRRQHSEAVRRCEHTMKELEYYRNQHHAAMSQLEAAAKESSSLRTMYSELIGDKQRLDREVNELRTSICNQQDVIVSESGNADSINQHFISTLSKYEVVKDEYESLRKRYDDLISSHSAAVDKLELAQEEVGRLKKQYEEMVQERNSALIELNALKQQCTAVIRQWDMALRDRNECQEALTKLQQQHDEAMKEINAAMAVRMKASKDLKRLTEDRNAAMAEYTLIMSERDSVHKEMEKLSEDLNVAYNKNQALETEMKAALEEKEALSYHIETLKREIASALHDRDEALKECNDLRKKFGEFTAKEESQREAFKSRFEFAYNRERDATRKDPREVEAASIDLFVKSQKERMDNLDQANQEIDRLTKENEKMRTELQEAVQEAQVSKRRRDWAFSERDKIMWERESIRTLCDQLRKERDRAVSNLAEALRDSDDIKKQRNETTKELKVLKEKMEAHMEKESRILQFHSTEHSHSHDSAIDTDLAEWDTEMLNINLNGLSSEENLGLELIGGRDDPFLVNDGAIYVANVAKGSVTDGKLRANDCIMRVNNFDCRNVSKRMVVETICSSASDSVVMVVKRRRIGARSLFTTHLQLNNYEHGLTLESGFYICRINPGSLAAKEGNLAVGDRVLSINNRPLDGVTSAREAMALLNEPSDLLTLTTLKATHCSSNCRAEITSRDVYKKYTNSSSQTDNKHTYLWYNEQPIYQVRDKAELQKPSSGGKWDSICGKIEMVDGRRSRSTKEDKKQIHNRNSSPVTFEQERDDTIASSNSAIAEIAELDSVLDSHGYKHNHHRKSKELDKNGGTWPKARCGPVIEHGTGTILHPRKNKERLPLSILLNNPNYSLSPCCQRPEEQRNSRIPQKEDGIDFSVKSGNIGKEVLEYYVKKKTPKLQYQTSDSESNADSQSHSQIHSQLYGTPHYPFTPFLHPISHSHAHTRCSSLSHQNSETVSLSDPRSYCFEPQVSSYSPITAFHHMHSPSVDSAYHKSKSIVAAHSHPGSYRVHDDMPESYQSYQGGTYPGKKENQRFRIPSNPSVASKSSGGKVSTGSIEKSSERGSPMPTFHVEVLSSGSRQNKRNSLPDYCWSQKPSPGELRRVHIDKSVEPLGIQISCLKSGGVFVSTVSEHSLASQVGLQVGDQLLEVCGINMRSATYQLAANVLRQCGNSITMLVQYSPDKYHELEGGSSSSGESRSDTPTPCNSPGSRRKSNPPPVAHTISTLTRQKNADSDDPTKSPIYEPRYLSMETHKCSNLGISLVGGNAVGIYVHSVQISSLAHNAGLRTGDRILEYNSTSLRQATAEEAAYELAKPADKVTILAQYNIDRYNEIKDKPGDSFYIRAMFDRTGDIGDALQLRFQKDDVLYVDNTMFNGIPGNWRAWLVDQDGYQHQCGIIPSKYKVEEELLLRRSLGDLEGRTRRSFFRRKKHQRSDSKELASFSSINLGWYSDSGSLNEETTLASYQRVVRLDSEPVFRPVIIVGPLSDCVIEKLIQDFPDKFVRCSPEIMHCSQSTIEKGISDNLFIDYRKKGTYFECTTVTAVKDSCDKNCHCVLDVGLASVERLHRHQVYPIVLLIKFKSTKQIKEVKDSRYPLDKIGAKAAKEMYEHALKLEVEYKHYISAVIPAGVNVAYMCTQIKAAVDLEQVKTLWVPCPNS